MKCTLFCALVFCLFHSHLKAQNSSLEEYTEFEASHQFYTPPSSQSFETRVHNPFTTENVDYDFSLSLYSAALNGFKAGDLVEFINPNNTEDITRKVISKFSILDYVSNEPAKFNGFYYYEFEKEEKTLRGIEVVDILAPVYVFGSLYRARFSLAADIQSCDLDGIQIINQNVKYNPEDNNHMFGPTLRALHSAFSGLFDRVAKHAILVIIEETKLANFCN
ncbi:MAG: hypothetical protein K2X39_05880 [Silvanigrellaceae bacterium]|nr:hypothetical protein [Silvanigrellaceae bacterium]